MNRARLLPLIVIAVVAGAALLISSRGTPAGSSNYSTAASSWSLPGLKGGMVALKQFRGTPTVVNFFASWCNPCRDELPAFAAMSRQLQGRVTFVGINSEETGDGLAMAKQFGVGAWPLARDIDGAADSGVHDAVGATGMPATAFYSADGRLLYVALGQTSAAALRADLLRYFGISVS